MVVFQESAPLLRHQSAVGLYAVVDGAPLGVFLLKLHGSLVEGERAHERLSPVPCEHHLRHCLRLDVFPDEAFQQFLAHHVSRHIVVEPGFLQIVAVVACQVAVRSDGFRHHVERACERCVGSRPVHD